MSTAVSDGVTSILHAWRDGDKSAPDALLRLLYDDLRALAAHRLGGRSARGTLHPTDLLNEAFLRLVQAQNRTWENRRHFIAAAGAAMRSVLVDRARAHLAEKRGGGRRPAELHEWSASVEDRAEETLAVHEALAALEGVDARAARVVTLRFFAGLTEAETADTLGVTERTVRRDWVFAKAWLHRAMRGDRGGERDRGGPGDRPDDSGRRTA